MRTRRSWRAAPLPLAVGLATLATVAATAGVAFAATTTTTTTPRPSFSTASGTVAALSTATSSMEVQSPSSGQVTVSWTTTTRFSETVTIAATKLVVGDCVTVVSASKNKTGPIAATTVSLRPSTNGSCSGAGGFGLAGAPPTGSGGFGGGSGARGFVGTAPGGSFPRRSGASRFGTGALGRFASGKVIEKSKSTFVVKGFAPGARPAASTSTKGSTSTTRPTRPALKAVETKVAFGTKTMFTTTEQVSASNLAVGVCATALGPANDIGAITANTISIRPAPKSGCTAAGGFGGFGGFFAGRGAA